MALRCKIGDLVVVTSCPIEKNIGLFATVVEVLRDPTDTGDWVIRPQTAMWGYMPDGRLELNTEDLSAPDSDLRPIRGGDISDDEVRELFLPAPVREVEHG